MVEQWIPQSVLLKEEKVKIFMTHGGFHSYVEACEAGVPVIAHPLSAND